MSKNASNVLQVVNKGLGGTKSSVFVDLMTGKQLTQEMTKSETFANEILTALEEFIKGWSPNIQLGALYTRLGLGRTAGKEACDWDTFVAVTHALAKARNVAVPDLKSMTRFQAIKLIMYAPFPEQLIRREGDKDDRAGKAMTKAMADYRAKVKETIESNRLRELNEVRALASKGEGVELPPIVEEKRTTTEPKAPAGKEAIFKAAIYACFGDFEKEQTIVNAFSTPIDVAGGKASIAPAAKVNQWYLDVRNARKNAADAESNIIDIEGDDVTEGADETSDQTERAG